MKLVKKGRDPEQISRGDCKKSLENCPRLCSCFPTHTFWNSAPHHFRSSLFSRLRGSPTVGLLEQPYAGLAAPEAGRQFARTGGQKGICSACGLNVTVI